MAAALTLVSYNISFAEPSSAAPNRAVRSREAPRKIREQCILSSRGPPPDVIALQECPGETWGGEVFGPEYVSVGTQLASHVEGHIDLLVRRELAQNARRITLHHPAMPLPSVASLITLPNGTSVAVCSLHLPHTAKGATVRELMCEAIMQIVSQQCANAILIGDFNMRDKEDSVVENLDGGGWLDLWKEATGKNQKLKFTWDSHRNLFHENGFGFTCRFDRCLVRGNELTARRFDMIGNKPASEAKGDFLSDHYGIVVEVGVLNNSGVLKDNDKKNNAATSNNDICMVDLTGDSDDEQDTMDTTANDKVGKRVKSNSDCPIVGDEKATMASGQIGKEEMRRLRLQKFSGDPVQSNGNDSLADERKPAHRSISTKSSPLPTLTTKPNKKSCSDKSNLVTCTPGDVEPLKPTSFSIIESQKPERYIIFMAIREKKVSNFARGMAKCNDISQGVKDCLQMDGTRHITMFDGKLTTNQVQNLTFSGHFDPCEIHLDGWQPWDGGCYLKLKKVSTIALQDLLARIDGLPPIGGKRGCDHLSLYRKRPTTKHPNPKKEFRRIREATESHDWGSVDGVSICIKVFGKPYDECLVLAESRQLTQNDENMSKPDIDARASSMQPLQNNEWNDRCNSDSERNMETDGKDSDETRVTTFRNFRPPKNSSLPLSIVSWNVSETTLSAISAAAPDPALRAKESAHLIREECLGPHFASQLHDKTCLPDVIALQETLDGSWGSTVFGPSGYVSIGTQMSHCGMVDLLIRKDFVSQRVLLDNGDGCLERNYLTFDDDSQPGLPSVAAIVTLPNKTRFAVASVHLEPHASGASTRAKQCEALMQLLSKKCDNVIVIGDFNMRQKEDRMIENSAGGGWIDAWKEGSASSKELKMTWDSFKNLYHDNGFGFTCRFDRCYVRGKKLGVKQFGLVGNMPVNEVEGDYLSDHFGLAVEVSVAPSPDNNHHQKKNTMPERRENGEAKSRRNLTSSRSLTTSLTQSSKDETANISITAPIHDKKQDHCKIQRKSKEEIDGWGSRGDSMGSDETPRRGNAKRSSLSIINNSRQITMKENNNGLKPFQKSAGEKQTTSKRMGKFDSSSSSDEESNHNNNGLKRFHERRKEKRMKAKKMHGFDSSSSEDGEEVLHRLRKKLAKKHHNS